MRETEGEKRTMGIQTTRFITRDDAERQWMQQYITNNQERLLREVRILTDTELEDALESTFDNYRITSTPEEN